MAEEQIFFHSGELKIEGLLENLQGEKGLVVTHPHPLYGGEMRNNVVEAITQAYCEQGYSTLRFNFRGVGKSEGSYEDGKGEQEDVKAALNFFAGLGKRRIDLAGYSFGAWVNALGAAKLEHVRRILMVSPPVNFVNFDFLKYNPKIQLVIVGDRDDIAGHKAIEKLMPNWNPDAPLRIIKGADHFYGGYTDALKAVIRESLERGD